MLTNGDSSSGPLTGSTDQLFRATLAYIDSSKDPLRTGLEINASHDKALVIELSTISKLLAVGCKADEDKYTRWMQFFSLAGLRIFRHDGIQMVIVALKLHNL